MRNKRIKIKKKIITAFLFVVLIMIAINLNTLVNYDKVVADVEMMELSHTRELAESSNLALSVQRVKSNLRELFLELIENEEDDEVVHAVTVIRENLERADVAMNLFRKATSFDLDSDDDLLGEKEEIEMLDTLRVLLNSFNSSTSKILDFHKTGSLDEMQDLFENDTEPISREIQEMISVLRDDAEFEVVEIVSEMKNSLYSNILVGIILAVLSVLCAVGIGLYISNSISKPLGTLIEGTTEIRKGNFEYKVFINTNDELKLLGESFNNMSSEMKEKILKINRLNTELLKSNQTKDKFFSIIAHDLRGPFNVILGFTDMLNTQYEHFDENEKREIIESIDKVSKGTFELLENLLTWSMAQSGRIDIKQKTFNLCTLTKKSVEFTGAQAAKKSINILNTVNDQLTVFVDEFTLTVILNNLISNAIKFTPNDGTVTVSAIENNNEVEISVKDTGVGMSEETINRMLSSDESVSTNGTNNEKGTGLGFVLVKDFVKKNNGRLNIISEIGHGSDFRFWLKRK
jgi:signal transduction histidine kinase